MARRSTDRLVGDTVYDCFELAVKLNERRHDAEDAGDSVAAGVIGGAKIVLVGMSHFIDPDQVRPGQPSDLLADTLGVKYLPGGLRPLHVPDRKWAELRAVPLFKKWFAQ